MHNPYCIIFAHYINYATENAYGAQRTTDVKAQKNVLVPKEQDFSDI